MEWRKLIARFYDLREASLWHPESPGCKVLVVRSRWGRLFKPLAFATLSESQTEGIVWRKVEGGRVMDAANVKLGPYPTCLMVIKPCRCQIQAELDKIKSDLIEALLKIEATEEQPTWNIDADLAIKHDQLLNELHDDLKKILNREGE